MKTIFTIIAVSTLSLFQVSAQKYFTRSASISFFSSTPVEDIEASNHQVSCIVDLGTGQVAFSVLIKGFEFEKALMQEHFNDKYVESSKYPKAKFQGKITDGMASLSEQGEHAVTVEGDLTIHGVKKPWETNGTITIMEDKILLNAVFDIEVSEFEIKIPGPVQKKVAEKVKTTVLAECKPFNK